MIYIEYEQAKAGYDYAVEIYKAVLSEKEELFQITQPTATVFDKERVEGGLTPDAYNRYLEEVERRHLDERLTDARQFVEHRKYILEDKEEELRRSKDRLDRIYRLRHIQGLSVETIAIRTNYSRSQIFRILRKIKKMRQNATDVSI